MSEIDDYFDDIRRSLKEGDEDDVPPAKSKTKATEEESTDTGDKPKRAGADYTIHKLGAELPPDAPPKQSAAQVSRDSVFANLEQCVADPGEWFVIASYGSRKTADTKYQAILDGKQPLPMQDDGETAHQFEIEPRTFEVDGERRHVVAARCVTGLE